MPESQTAREEIQLSCIQTNNSSVYESCKCIPPPKIQWFPTEAPNSCSVSVAQWMSKAITIAPASRLEFWTSHFSPLTLQTTLPAQKLAQAVICLASPRWAGLLCPYTQLSPAALQHSSLASPEREMPQDPGETWTLQMAPPESNQPLCQQNKLWDFCGP